MLGGFHLCLTNFGEFERAAQIGPRAAAIDDRLDSQARVNILSWILAYCTGGLRVQVARCNLAEKRSSGQHFHE